jgi:para-nitrobenzyl esterase
MVSPLATGTFDQAILQSPGAMRNWNTLETAEEQGLSLGEDLEALRALPATEIEHLRNVGGGTDFRALALPRVIGPTLDGFVLPALEREAFEAGRANAVPLLIGTVTDEGGLFTGAYEIATVEEYQDYLGQDVIFGEGGEEAAALYPVGDVSNIPAMVAASFGDNQFVFGTRGVARAVADRGEAVYRYMFTRPTEGGVGQAPGHGFDLAYAFGDDKLATDPYNDEDRALSATIMDAWVRFAGTGDPNGGEITDWPAYDSANEPVLVLDVVRDVVNAPDTERLDFMGERWLAGTSD